MNKAQITWIAAALLVMFMLVGYFFTSGYFGPKRASQADNGESAGFDQAIARRGNLTVSISGSGTLTPNATAELGFQETGTLVALPIAPGDRVQAGDLLARLKIDKTDAERAAEVAAGELEVARAQAALDNLYATAHLDAAQALVSLEQAQTNLAEVEDVSLEQAQAQQAVAQAEETIADTEYYLTVLASSASQQDLDIAYASLQFKEKDLAGIQDKIAKIEFQVKSAPNKLIREQLRLQLLNLQVRLAKQKIEVQQATYHYEHLDDPADLTETTVAEAQLATAQSQLAEAKAELEAHQSGPKAGDLALAEAEVTTAQAARDQLSAGPIPEELTKAQAGLTRAQAKLAQVKAEQPYEELLAPFDGTVLSVEATVGDRLGQQTVLTLADTLQTMVEVYLDESDSSYVQVGDAAEVTFDAIPDKSYRGEVVSIDPSLANLGNSPAVRARVQIETGSVEELKPLPIGLNASVEIISGETQNAVLVPIEALHKLESGEYAVYVIQGNGLQLQLVTVGLKDYTTAEILDGLEAGQAVAIGGVPAFGRSE